MPKASHLLISFPLGDLVLLVAPFHFPSGAYWNYHSNKLLASIIIMAII